MDLHPELLEKIEGLGRYGVKVPDEEIGYDTGLPCIFGTGIRTEDKIVRGPDPGEEAWVRGPAPDHQRGLHGRPSFGPLYNIDSRPNQVKGK